MFKDDEYDDKFDSFSIYEDESKVSFKAKETK